jgi:hypothetical protein
LGDRKFQSNFKKVAKIAEVSIKYASFSFRPNVGKMLEASQWILDLRLEILDLLHRFIWDVELWSKTWGRSRLL